jgi:hypothetical protein
MAHRQRYEPWPVLGPLYRARLFFDEVVIFSFTLCEDHSALGALIFFSKNRNDVELALSRKKMKSESKYDKRSRHGNEHFLVTCRCSPGNSKIALA